MENKALQIANDLDTEQQEIEIVGIHTLCRLCASQNERLIGIFSEEGISNDLSNKINLYLPIKVAASDELPLQCCWNCASTLLAWHELVLTSVEIDRKFRNSQFITEKQIIEDEEGFDNSTNPISDDNDACDNNEGKSIKAKPASTEATNVEEMATSSLLTSNLITFDCNLDVDTDTIQIINMLPQRKTCIREACIMDKDTDPKLRLRFLTDLRNEDQIKEWISELENNTKTSYSVDSSPTCSGKYVILKRRLRCQHNTRCRKLYESGLKTGTRNTNCPSRLIVTLHAINEKKRFRGKNKEKHAALIKMPCEISFIATHNHPTTSVEALRFRKMSPKVKEKLIDLFKMGHSASSALETLKTEIQMTHENYEEVLADGKFFPSYNACYYLYMNEFKKQYGPLDFNTGAKKILIDKLKDYNKEMGNENCSRVIFKDADYVICLCPPLFMRVHKYIKTASEVVFIYETGSLDHDGSRVLILLTHSQCGRLPLAIIITSSECASLIGLGFDLLKEMLGDKIFGGGRKPPDIFITDDSSAIQNAIKTTWPQSKCALCSSSVLQSVWKWLIKSKNGLPLEKQLEFYKQVKSIMYAKTPEDAFESYKIAKNSSIEHQNYQQFLDTYWERREVWVLSYRSNPELHTRTIKEKIFDRIKALNVVQMVDFILSDLVDYYERRLLDASHNRQRNTLAKKIQAPPEGILDRIVVLSDTVLLVPSEKQENEVYLVNMDVAICGCVDGLTGKGCKHIDWGSKVVTSEKPQETMSGFGSRKLFHLVATGVKKKKISHVPQPNDSVFVNTLLGTENRVIEDDEDVGGYDCEGDSTGETSTVIVNPIEKVGIAGAHTKRRGDYVTAQLVEIKRSKLNLSAQTNTAEANLRTSYFR